MPKIEGEHETRTEDPTQCEELADFSCGNGETQAEKTVNRIVKSLYATPLEDAPEQTVRVTREAASGKLIGLATIEPSGYLHRAVPEHERIEAVYLFVIALHADYRGRYTTQEGKPLSEVLIDDALAHIAEVTDEMPPVHAVVHPENGPSRSLIESRGFRLAIEKEEILYYRPRGLPLEEERI